MTAEEQMLENFKKFLDNTPKEKLDAMINDIEAKGIEGPTVDEYFEQFQPPQYHIEKFKALYRKRLEEEIKYLKPSDDKMHMAAYQTFKLALSILDELKVK